MSRLARALWLVWIVAGVLGAAIAVVPASVALAVPNAAAGSRVSWQGKSWYLSGANVPWFNWQCDFGCGPDRGVSADAVRRSIENAFMQAKAAQVRVLRWWVFEGDPWQITTDAQGAPSGVDPAVYADFDAALALAQTHDLYYDFVLFNAPSALPPSWLSNPATRARLASALAPLFARYRGNPHLLSWEVFNEPDFDIWKGAAQENDVREVVRAIATSVHQNSNAYVTVGTGFLDGLPMFTGLGLDYYQSHWYDYMNSGDYCAICTDYATVRTRYGLDAPLVIGELYVDPSTPGRFETFYQKGYAGAWPWSLFPSHTSDGMTIDLAQAKALAAAHSDLGPRSGGVPPATATATPVPTVTPAPVPTAPSTLLPTLTPEPAPMPTPAPAATPVPTATQLPAATPTLARTPTPTATPVVASEAPVALLQPSQPPAPPLARDGDGPANPLAPVQAGLFALAAAISLLAGVVVARAGAEQAGRALSLVAMLGAIETIAGLFDRDLAILGVSTLALVGLVTVARTLWRRLGGLNRRATSRQRRP